MEDGEAVELVHDAIQSDQNNVSYIGMGGGRSEDADHLVTEGTIIGFWEFYRNIMSGERKV